MLDWETYLPLRISGCDLDFRQTNLREDIMKRLFRGMLTAAWVALSGFAAHALEVGNPAPDFTGESTRGAVQLSALRGQNVVLAFYFADFTPV